MQDKAAIAAQSLRVKIEVMPPPAGARITRPVLASQPESAWLAWANAVRLII